MSDNAVLGIYLEGYVLDGVYADRVCMSEWIGGARGYDWAIENNEDIFDLLSDYNGRYIAFGI